MIWFSIAASAYLLIGAAFGLFLTRQLPKQHELRRRYAEISTLTLVHPTVLAYGTALVWWPLVVVRLAVWGWPKDESS